MTSVTPVTPDDLCYHHDPWCFLQVLLASSFVPVYAGFQAVEFQGEVGGA